VDSCEDISAEDAVEFEESGAEAAEGSEGFWPDANEAKSTASVSSQSEIRRAHRFDRVALPSYIAKISREAQVGDRSQRDMQGLKL
jgi:hypothetical protein